MDIAKKKETLNTSFFSFSKFTKKCTVLQKKRLIRLHFNMGTDRKGDYYDVVTPPSLQLFLASKQEKREGAKLHPGTRTHASKHCTVQ